MTTVFYERRKECKSIEFIDRRIDHRRKQEAPISQDRRRLASQVRRYEREAFKIPVRLKVQEKEISGYTHDICLEGLLVFTDTAMSPGTPMALKFSFGENVCHLNVSGQVVFCRSSENDGSNQHSIGIKFSGIRDFEKKILTSAVQELKQNISTQKKSLLNILVSKDTSAKEASRLFIRTPITIGKWPNTHQSSPNANQTAVDNQKSNAVKRGRKFTPDPDWVIEMNQYLEPYRQAILQSRIVQETSTGELSLGQVQAWNVQLYPFIENFPRFMALNLAKALDPLSRTFLIDNIRVEKRHAAAWIDMAKGFGIKKEELLNSPILPEVEALTHWMWSINSRGSIVEGISATNYAIEGITQGIASIVIKGFEKYNGKNGVHLDKKSYWWMEAHAIYDDLHPLEALEIIKLHATSYEMQQMAKHAAQRSLEYMYIALEACYAAYAPDSVIKS